LNNISNFMYDQKFNRVLLRIDASFEFFSCDDIIYIEASNTYVVFFLINYDKGIRIKNTLEFVENLLPHDFFLCHRSFIVNLKHVTKISTYGNKCYKLVLINKNKIPISSESRKKYLRNISFH